MAQAEMNAGAEGHVPVRPPREIELLGMGICGRVVVGGSQHGHDLIAMSQLHAAQLRVPANEARLAELHRRDEAQELLDREIRAPPIRLQPVPQRRILQELVDRAADQMAGGLVPREQQQKDHRDHLVATDLGAFLLGPHQLGDQPFAAPGAGGGELRFQVTLDRSHVPHQPPKQPQRIARARDIARPRREFRPVGGRQAE